MNPLHRSSYRPINRTNRYLPLSRTPSHRRPKPSVNSTHSAERSGDESVTINIELSYRSQSSGTSSLQKNRKPSGKPQLFMSALFVRALSKTPTKSTASVAGVKPKGLGGNNTSAEFL